MSKIDQDILTVIEAALDTWIEDNSVIFLDESDQRKALFASIKRRNKEWAKPQACMYPDCTQRTIRRSHALQKSRVLEQIAEDGHVCTPEINSDGNLYIRRIGLGEASTFPGFCVAHENMFSEFEQSGEIENVRHAVLQIFRTVCREISRRRFIVEQLEIDRDEYVARRTTYFENEVRRVTGHRDFSIGDLKGDPKQQMAEDAITRTRGVLSQLQLLYNELASEIETGKGKTDGHILRLPFVLPIALSGIVLVDYRKRSERIRTAPVAIGVVPQFGGCVVFLLTLRNHAAFARGWARKLEFGPSSLDLVEGWMTHGTDHWFVPPSLWNNLSLERQQRILKDLQSTEGVPSADPAEPIFDDLRRTFIAALKQQQLTVNGLTGERLAELIASEEKKSHPSWR
jgi:hypothetical protein